MLSSEHEILIDLLREVNHRIADEIKIVLEQRQLSFTIMIISRQIKAQPGITISELARKTGIAKSHISNNIKELNQRGWVEIKTDERDRRLLRLFLFPAAIDQMEVNGNIIRQRLSGLLSELPESRTTQIIESIRDIQQALERSKQKERSND